MMSFHFHVHPKDSALGQWPKPMQIQALPFLNMLDRTKMGVNLGGKAVGRLFNCGQGGGWRRGSDLSPPQYRGGPHWPHHSEAHPLIISCAVNPLNKVARVEWRWGRYQQCRGECLVAKHRQQRRRCSVIQQCKLIKTVFANTAWYVRRIISSEDPTVSIIVTISSYQLHILRQINKIKPTLLKTLISGIQIEQPKVKCYHTDQLLLFCHIDIIIIRPYTGVLSRCKRHVTLLILVPALVTSRNWHLLKSPGTLKKIICWEETNARSNVKEC